MINLSPSDRSQSSQPELRLPPLANGDRLTRHEFERCYAAAPHVKSQMFPRLWLAIPALLSGAMPQVLTVLQQGLKSAEHGIFRQWLAGEK